MTVSRKRNNSDDDFLKVGPDATATFDNFPSNPTEYATSEHLDDTDTEEDDEEEDEDLDEEEEDEEEEEYDDDEDEDEEEYEDDEDDEDEEDDDDDEDEDLAKGPRAPSAYRKR